MATTPDAEAKRLEVLAVYAICGNAAKAARDAGVAERTARTWVAKAIESNDEALAGIGRKLRARILDATTRGALVDFEKAQQRGHSDEWCAGFHSDPGPTYLKVANDILKTLIAAERLDAQRSGDIPPDAVEIRITRLGESGEAEDGESGRQDD